MRSSKRRPPQWRITARIEAGASKERAMELYANPILTTARPILLFVAENDLDFVSVIPNGLVPVLVDGDLRLTRTPAILKYLADLIHAPAYPADLHRRARVNERMDWLSANFHRSFGCDPVYPQVFPQARAGIGDTRLRDGACDWLQELAAEIGGQGFLCGEKITIADYLGAAYVCAGEALGCCLNHYPNIDRWLANMRRLKNWPSVFGAADFTAQPLSDGAAARL
jgi:glutathione S-transferase